MVIELLNQILSRADHGEILAVCTLVRTRGSTPQKAGATMLVLSDGKTLGTIGGGCVEAEVRTRALQSLSRGGSELFTFQLDHDHGWDDGLVCGGSMDVAMQIVSQPANAGAFREARDQMNAGQPARLVISVPDAQGNLIDFDLPIDSAPMLIIAGAGHVGAALAAMARLMDFSVLVIDDRPDYATADRFPGATRKIGAVETELSKIHFDDQSYIVIVTRGHRRDALALSAVIRSKARYIGLIGSRRKILKIFADLHQEGISIEQLSRVHAPIGLSIGAITPAEIAVSIAAELIANRRGLSESKLHSMKLTTEQLHRMKNAQE